MVVALNGQANGRPQSKIRSREGELNVPRLAEAMFKSRLTTKRFREEMRETVRQMVGRHWSDEGTTKTVPLNLIYIYQSIVGRRLISANPRAMLTTWDPRQRATVDAMQSWINEEVENMNFAESVRRVISSALYSVGFSKVSLATPGESAIQNWNMKVGQPYYDEVLLDDAVWDIHAKRFEELGYIGNRMRVPIDVVKDSKIYNKNRLKLEPQSDPFFNREGDERIGVLSRSFYSSEEEYEDFVDLWEVYLPRRRMVITIADDAVMDLGGSWDSVDVLRAVDWVGPDGGPYDMLSLGNTVPGNMMPAAPLQNLRDLHDPVNDILRKLIRQAARYKSVTAVRNGATEDGNRYQQANDGDIVRFDGEPPAVVPGDPPNVQLFELMNSFKEMFSWSSGNLDIIGGLSPQSKTASQDRMLNANSSALLGAMQDQVVGHVQRVMKKLCWYWWYHPKNVLQTSFTPQAGPDYAIPRTIYPASHPGPGLKRSGRLSDMGFKVDPYSLQAQTPETQMQALDQTMQTVVIPLMQALQGQGVSVDLGKYLGKKAKYMNMPDLTEIISIVEPQQPGNQGQQDIQTPQATQRSYVRESRSNNTQANQAAESSQRMRGAIGMNAQNGTVNR